MHGGCEGRLGIGDLEGILVDLLSDAFYPVDMVRFFMEAVITEFFADIEDKEDAEGDADGEAQDIEQAIPFVTLKIAEGDG